MRAQSFIAPPQSTDTVEFSEALLWAGDLVVDAQPMRLTTVLGSCVSVCLYDLERRSGGMNHFLVPRGQNSLMHGEWATGQLVARMQALGSPVRSLQAKLFGGGAPLQLEHEALAVGAQNVDIARQALASFGIPIVVERVGHNAGIRVFFENWSGVAWVRRHAPSNP